MFTNQNVTDFLSSSRGKYIVLNLMVNAKLTAAALNLEPQTVGWTTSTGSTNSFPRDAIAPFQFTDETAYFSYDQLNVLARNFEIIWKAVPEKAKDQNQNKVSIGKIPRGGPEMEELLKNLQHIAGEFKSIIGRLNESLDTEMYLNRKRKTSWVLLENGAISKEGRQLLSEFERSVAALESLPELREFGTSNRDRKSDRPHPKCDKFRYFLNNELTKGHHPCSPLEYVDYELKPLNINGMKWESEHGDPRTDSIDLLFHLNGEAVITEVKMDGDSFLSEALVQLLYYGCPLACEKQKKRLRKHYAEIKENKTWLCLLHQTRDTGGESDRKRFKADKDEVIGFLKLNETRDSLEKFFAGIFIVEIEDTSSGKLESFSVADCEKILWSSST